MTLWKSTFAALFFVAYAIVVWVFAAPPVRAAECQTMVASWYGTESGNRTANGERFNGTSLTAAHKTLPFGTKLRVTYQGKSVVVRINDRGPYIKGRSLDLSRAAAVKIGLIPAGVARVCVKRL
jgi:rare lipoprotein A